MRYFIFVLFILLCGKIYSQPLISKLPKVTIADLSTDSCSIDPSKSAAILNDIGYTYFQDRDGRIEFVYERTTRIKVYNKEGYNYTEIIIPLRQEKRYADEIVEFSATSYTLKNGEIVKTTIGENSLYEEEVNKWGKRKKFTFPNIKEGSIVEYSYKIFSPFVLSLRPWYFQREIPTFQSRFKINICPYYNYIVLRNGFIKYKLDTTYTLQSGFKILSQEYKTKVYEWEVDSVPAFTQEPYMTTPTDYLMKAEFQLASFYDFDGVRHEVITTWKQLIDLLLKEYNTFFKNDKTDTKQIVASLNLENKSTVEKAKIIWKYVIDNFYSNGILGNPPTQTKRSLIKSKTGSVQDINLLLVSLMRTAGIDAYPLLLSTRNHGKLHRYPLLKGFNYVAVLIYDNRGRYYLDATDPLLPFGLLPKRCINDYGLEVKKIKSDKEVKLYALNPSIKDVTNTQVVLNINVQNDMSEASVNSKFTGYKAAYYRKYIINNSKETFYDQVLQSNMYAMDSIKIDNLKNTEKKLIVNLKLSKALDKSGDKIFINPLIFNPYPENIFSFKDRIYPVNFGSYSQEYYYTTLNIPEGYKIDYIPKSESFDACDGTLSFSSIVNISGSYVQIAYIVKREKIEYKPDQNKELNEFYNKVVKSCNQKIILTKTAL